jgi:hypothetical protein
MPHAALVHNFTLKLLLSDLEPWAGPLNSKDEFYHLVNGDHDRYLIELLGRED